MYSCNAQSRDDQVLPLVEGGVMPCGWIINLPQVKRDFVGVSLSTEMLCISYYSLSSLILELFDSVPVICEPLEE